MSGVAVLAAATAVFERELLAALDASPDPDAPDEAGLPAGFDFRGLVDDVALVLEEIDLREALVVGHSMGGAIALGLAVFLPDVVAARLRGLVLVTPRRAVLPTSGSTALSCGHRTGRSSSGSAAIPVTVWPSAGSTSVPHRDATTSRRRRRSASEVPSLPDAGSLDASSARTSPPSSPMCSCPRWC